MVWRDLDFTVICSELDAECVATIGARLAVHPRIQQVLIRDDTGSWNTDPTYPDGLYLGLRYRSPGGSDWKLDIWFVDDPDHQPDLSHLRNLTAQLTPGKRGAILLIKSWWACRPEYGTTVRSVDIYSAVLDDGVRDADQFDQWLATRSSGASNGGRRRGAC